MAMDLTAGAELPAFVRETGLPNWNRYAAVNDEFIPIHMEDEAGRAAGFPTAIGMGNLLWSYAHILLRDWMGEHGRIEQVSAKFQQPNLRNTTVTVHGRVAEASPADGGARVAVELWTTDDTGRTLTTGQATVWVDAAAYRSAGAGPHAEESG
jgi:acyl dehydratase